MNIAQTAATNAGKDETMGGIKFPYLPLQIIATVLEKETKNSEGESPVTVFRYPVIDGWIVGTVFKESPLFAQTFVPDPDHIWTPTFSEDAKTSPDARQP